jgi:hypothetical protein
MIEEDSSTMFASKRLTTRDQIHDSGSGMDRNSALKWSLALCAAIYGGPLFNKAVYRHTKSSVLSYVVNLTILVHGCAKASLPQVI